MARRRLRRQEQSATVWTSWRSMAVWGWKSSKKLRQNLSWATRSSDGMTTVWPVRPWRRALRLERCLPSGVRGPVGCMVNAFLDIGVSNSNLAGGVKRFGGFWGGEARKLLWRLGGIYFLGA